MTLPAQFLVPLLPMLLLAAQPPLPAPPSAAPAPPGIIIVVGGVGGLDFLGGAALIGLPRVGVSHEIREFVWTHGWGHWLLDLRDTDHLEKKAAELARIIGRLKDEE